MEQVTKRKAGRPRKISQEKIDKILELFDQGWGSLTISVELKIGRERARYYIHKYRGVNARETKNKVPI